MSRKVEPKVPYIVEVKEVGSGNWLRNGMRFATAEEADEWGMGLLSRWHGISTYRVVDLRTEEVVA